MKSLFPLSILVALLGASTCLAAFTADCGLGKGAGRIVFESSGSYQGTLSYWENEKSIGDADYAIPVSMTVTSRMDPFNNQTYYELKPTSKDDHGIDAVIIETNGESVLVGMKSGRYIKKQSGLFHSTPCVLSN